MNWKVNGNNQKQTKSIKMSSRKYPDGTICFTSFPGVQLTEVGGLICSLCFTRGSSDSNFLFKVIHVGGLIKRKIISDKAFRKAFGTMYSRKELLPDYIVNSIVANEVALCCSGENRVDSPSSDQQLNNQPKWTFVLVGYPRTKFQLDFALRNGFINPTSRFIIVDSTEDERLVRLQAEGVHEANPHYISLMAQSEKKLNEMIAVATAGNCARLEIVPVASRPVNILVPDLMRRLVVQ